VRLGGRDENVRDIPNIAEPKTTIENTPFEQFRLAVESELRLSNCGLRIAPVLEWNEVVFKAVVGSETSMKHSFPTMMRILDRARCFSIRINGVPKDHDVLRSFAQNGFHISCSELDAEIDRIKCKFPHVPAANGKIPKGTSAAVAKLLIGEKQDTSIGGNLGFLVRPDHIYLFLHALINVHKVKKVKQHELQEVKSKQSGGDALQDLKRRAKQRQSTVEKVREYAKTSKYPRTMFKGESELVAMFVEERTRIAIDAYEQVFIKNWSRLSNKNKEKVRKCSPCTVSVGA